MVTSEPNSGSVGESPTHVDIFTGLGGGEDPPRARAALLDGKAPLFASFLVHRKLFGPVSS